MKEKLDTEILLKPFKDFYFKYKNWILGVTVIVVLVVSLSVLTVVRLKQTRKYVFERISMAEGYLYQKNFTEGYKILDEIITRYKNSKYGGYAMYIKASYLYENGDYNSALQICKDILKIKKPKSVIVPASYMLGICYMSVKDYDNAIKVFKEITEKFADSFYTPRVYEVLAMCYEIVGNNSEALKIYEKMNTLYPNTYWSDLAQKKLAEIEGEK